MFFSNGWIQQHIAALQLLFAFYFRHVRQTIGGLPNYMQNPGLLSASLSHHGSLTFDIDSNLIKDFNDDLQNLRTKIKQLIPVQNFANILRNLVVVRVLLIAAASTGSFGLFFAVSTLQFVVAPLSLFVGCGMFFALVSPMIAAHYIVYSILQQLTPLAPQDLQFGLVIDMNFVVTAMLVDQLLCALVAFTPMFCKPRWMGWRRAAWSIGYGFVNSKSQNLAMLLLFEKFGVRLNLTAFLIDWGFSLTSRLADVISGSTVHWAPAFYLQHRMAHLPRVYEHAHKMHHYLHDTTAFDAHIYGSGFPEEWFHLVVETAATVLFGIFPMSLSSHLLNLSWANKIGHTRHLEDGNKEVLEDKNAHADHHKFHNKNFGIYGAMYDVIFGTNAHRDRQQHPYGQTDYSHFDFIGSPQALVSTALNGCKCGCVCRTSEPGISEGACSVSNLSGIQHIRSMSDLTSVRRICLAEAPHASHGFVFSCHKVLVEQGKGLPARDVLRVNFKPQLASCH